MTKFVIIVAGGSGTRMGSTIPKQFLLLNGLPVLMHTITGFYEYDTSIRIIVALPASQTEIWRELCHSHNFNVEHLLVHGGITRFHSVKNALALVHGKAVIAVHDGVRPLASADTIKRCFEEAECNGTAVPVIPCTDSLRQITEDGSLSVNRNQYRLVQTPQVFQSDILLDAYKQPYMIHFTDDASVVECAGYSINLVEGNRENIKITTPQDLLVAEAFVREILK